MLRKLDENFKVNNTVLSNELKLRDIDPCLMSPNEVVMEYKEDLSIMTSALDSGNVIISDISMCVIESKTQLISDKERSAMNLELSTFGDYSKTCEMCENYKNQLQLLLNKSKVHGQEFNKLNEENEANIKLIFTVRELNNKLLHQVNDAAASHGKTIIELTEKYHNLSEFCGKLRATYKRFRESADKEFKHIINERRNFKMKIEVIETAYENLLGIRENKTDEIKSIKIDLPKDLEGAQKILLTLRRKLIEAKCTNEHFNSKIQSLEKNIKDMEKDNLVEKETILKAYNKNRKKLESEIESLQTENNNIRQSIKLSNNLEETVQFLKIELKAINKNYSNLEDINESLKIKITNLQHEFDNSESVQQDFVRLSQTLQIQLENIRQEGKELRWQFKEDVNRCNACHFNLQSHKKKYHCRHCGKVFCKSCLVEILSGVNKRVADVCKICHTMLVKNAAPYFNINTNY